MNKTISLKTLSKEWREAGRFQKGVDIWEEEKAWKRFLNSVFSPKKRSQSLLLGTTLTSVETHSLWSEEPEDTVWGHHSHWKGEGRNPKMDWARKQDPQILCVDFAHVFGGPMSHMENKRTELIWAAGRETFFGIQPCSLRAKRKTFTFFWGM